MANDPATFSESVCSLAARIARTCGPRDADEFWRLIRLAQAAPKPTA